jgi:type IV secretion system protein VirD4
MAFPFFSRREPPVIGSDAPDAFYLGRYFDEKTGRVGPKMQIPGTEPIVVVGRNRSGKDAGLGNYNALRLRDQSIVWVDPRGEAAAICAPYRRTLGPTKVDNPFGILTDIYGDLESDGWGAASDLDALSPQLFDASAALSEAYIPMEEKHPHFSHRARGFWNGFTMAEVIEAAADGRPALMANVRDKATEAEEFDPNTGAPIKGPRATALRLAQSGNPQIQSLVAGITGNSDEVQGVLATADGATQCLLSTPVRQNEIKNGIRLKDLGERPTSLFICMPHEMVQPGSMHAPYLRVELSAALRSLYRPTKTACTFWINEFAAFGRVAAIESSIGLVAGYGIRIIIVVQSLTQLKEIYKDAWENFLGNAAATVLVGAPADKFTAEYLASRSGEMTIRQPNVGMTLNPGGIGLSNGEAYTRRQYLMPMDLYGLQPGYGYVWVAGLSNAIPAYFPPYWDVDLLRKRSRANPYYNG